MRIGMPELAEHGHEVRIQARVELEGRTECLWYSVDRRYADYLTTDKLDGFVVGLLLPAMTAHEDMYVEGPVSEKLHWNLTHYYMRIMASVNPTMHPVRIQPSALDDGRQRPQPPYVGTGFSAGIDSFCVLADHFYGDVPPGYKVTHLVFNNVGAHRKGGRPLFVDRYDRLRLCADALGLPLIAIDSNLNDFFTLSFGQTHVARNLSAILTLQGLFGRYLYASTHKYEDCFVTQTHDVGHTDPMAVHLLSTETTDCLSTGAQYSRVEKTARVAEIELSRDYLDVCFDRTGAHGAGNCSVCKKCMRTQLTLEILGLQPLYARAFRHDRYRKERNRFIAKMLSSDDPLLKEIGELARRNRYGFPLRCRLLAALRSTARHMRNRHIS